jgi:hypothetical protein
MTQVNDRRKNEGKENLRVPSHAIAKTRSLASAGEPYSQEPQGREVCYQMKTQYIGLEKRSLIGHCIHAQHLHSTSHKIKKIGAKTLHILSHIRLVLSYLGNDTDCCSVDH